MEDSGTKRVLASFRAGRVHLLPWCQWMGARALLAARVPSDLSHPQSSGKAQEQLGRSVIKCDKPCFPRGVQLPPCIFYIFLWCNERCEFLSDVAFWSWLHRFSLAWSQKMSINVKCFILGEVATNLLQLERRAGFPDALWPQFVKKGLNKHPVNFATQCHRLINILA